MPATLAFTDHSECSALTMLVQADALDPPGSRPRALKRRQSNSPILFWIDRGFGQQGASEFIGVMELTTAALFASRRWSPRLALIGGLLGIGTFLTTLSFIVTTPNVANSFPFLVKDLTLLGAATWLAGEAWGAIARSRP